MLLKIFVVFLFSINLLFKLTVFYDILIPSHDLVTFSWLIFFSNTVEQK